MSLVYAGKLALSAILPSSVTAVASASASLSATLPVVAADLAGAVTLDAQVTVTPPNLSAEVSAVAAIQAGLAAAVTLGAPPFVDFQVSSLSSLIAELTPIVPALSASLALTLPMASLFLESGAAVWSFSGTGAEFGSLAAPIASGIGDGSSPKAELEGFVLASTGGGTWAGLQSFFPSLPGTQPSSTLIPLGSLGIGALFGLLSSALGGAGLRLELELGSLGARLEGALAAQASLTITPPSLAVNIALAADLAASLAATPPSAYISASDAIAAAAALVANLTALEAQINGDVTALASVTTALATAGVLAFRYSGTAADVPAAVASAVGSGWPDGTGAGAATNAVVILASGGGTASALSTLFGGL